MYKIATILLTIFVLQAGADAADKIRIAIPTLGAHFMTYPLAQRRAF